MPVGAFVPSRIHLDYPEWQAPLIGNIGQVWAYDGTGYAPVALDFDPAGTAAAAVAAHVGLSNPHSQYYLASGVSGFGATLASAADAAAARTALALGTAATLNVGTGANNVVQLDGSSRLPAVDGSQLTGVTVAAAGSTTQVIYNNAGVYAGHSGMTYNSANSRLTVAGGMIAGDWSPPSDSTTAVIVWNAARTTRIVTVDTSGNGMRLGASAASGSLGIGAAPSVQFGLQVDRTYASPAVTFCAGMTGEFSVTTTAGSALVLYGLNFSARANYASGTIGTVAGINVSVRQTNTGAVTNAYGVLVRSTTNTAGGTQTNNYGVYVESQATATNNYALYTNAGDIRLMSSNSDKIGFHGVAPVARQLLATGAGATVDQVITALQNLGLLRQS